MHKRKLTELNLLDDFLFTTMVAHPIYGESFSRKLLRIIFGREFKHLRVEHQKSFPGADTDLHGARLDVYLEEDEQELELLAGNAVYDIEPNTRRDEDIIHSLPRRVRFYHAKIDADSLTSGDSYSTLKNVIVILITPYDPFGLNRMIYTIQSMCREAPDMDYEDGARTLFLYTRGTEGNPPQELVQLLKYMEDTQEENAANERLQELHQMVETVRRDKNVGLHYMKSYEINQYYFQQGVKQEHANTERERLRAEAAEAELLQLKAELQSLRKLLAQ